MSVQRVPHSIVAGWFIFATAIAAPLIGQAAPTSSEPTVLKGLTVMPAAGCIKARKPADPNPPQPKLVSSFPAVGATVKPGIVLVRLTYDLPVACPVLLKRDGRFADPCPYPVPASMVSKDRRTFLAVCVVQPKARYGMWLNATSLAGQRLEPRDLVFDTSGDETVRVIRDAVAEDPVLQTMAGAAPDAFIPALPMDAGLATAAQERDSTVVRGLVIQGRLSHEVRGLIVTPGRTCLPARSPPDPDVPGPKLVSSFPAKGAVVKPGIVVLRLTFDLPMACPGQIGADFPISNPCPAPLADPVISADRRTFMTVCAVKPNARYGIRLNPQGDDGANGAQLLMSSGDRPGRPRWTNLAGHELPAQEITFTTSGAEPVHSLQDAIAEDAVLRTMIAQAAEGQGR